MVQTEVTRLKRTVARLKREKELLREQVKRLHKFEDKLVERLNDLAEEFDVFLHDNCI